MKEKVLLVSCDGFGNGGVQSVMMSIVRNLTDKYTFDALLFTNEKRFYDDEFSSYGGKILRIPHYQGKNKLRKKADYYIRGHRLYKNALKLIKENGPYNVVHCNNVYESAPILKAAAKAHISVRIIHSHMIEQKHNFVADILENHRKKVIEKYATVKIACSKEACDTFFSDSKNAFVINNAYDNRKFNKNNFESDINIKNPSFVQIGSYSEGKNQIFSLEIIEHIKKQYPNVMLTFVGFPMGNYEEKLRFEIKKRNLSKNVTMLPSNVDTPALLANASGFLFPSKSEGFGIVLIEAQAMGVRCYTSTGVPKTTNCGGVTYIPLSDGAEKWADIIISDYKRTNGLHESFDISPFTVESVMKYYKKIYKGGTL